MFLGPVLILAVGLPFLILALASPDLWSNLEIERSGKTTAGQVVGVKNTERRIRLETHRESHYEYSLVRFTYSVDGKSYDGVSEVLGHKTPPVGSSVRVEYARSDPSLSRLKDHGWGLDTSTVMWIVCFFAFVLLAPTFSLIQIPDIIRIRKVIRTGVPAFATVTSDVSEFLTPAVQSPEKPSETSKSLHALAWKFEVNGKVHTGRTMVPFSWELAEQVRTGRVVVWHLPREPQVSYLFTGAEPTIKGLSAQEMPISP